MKIATRWVSWVVFAIAVTAAAQTSAEDAPHRFDGTWDTVLSCPNSTGAMGYSFHFDSIVIDDQLHAEKGTKGQAGWLEMNGKVLSDGVSHLLVNGLVGAADFAVGRRPAGTSYAYKVDAQFSDDQATGKRVEGRPCDVTFHRTSHPAGKS